MKKTLYKLHKLSGLTLGIFIFLLALSGVIITFREELLPVVYAEFRVTPAGAELRPEVQLRNAQAYIGHRTVTNFYANGEADEASLILFKDPAHSLPQILVMNPYSGNVIGEMPLIKNIFAVALFFHANFFLGKTGEWLVGILGLVLVLFVFTGIYIWLPKLNVRQKLNQTFSGKLSRQKLHHQVGLLLALPLIISALTGFLTVFDLSYVVMKNLRHEPTRPDEMSKVVTCNFENDMKAIGNLSHAHLKNLISIHLCGKKNALIRVSYGVSDRHPTNGYSRILIDPETQKIVQSFDSSKDPSSWNIKRLFIYPLHSGEIFGILGKTIIFLTGLGLMLIFITGILLTFHRAKRSRLIHNNTIN